MLYLHVSFNHVTVKMISNIHSFSFLSSRYCDKQCWVSCEYHLTSLKVHKTVSVTRLVFCEGFFAIDHSAEPAIWIGVRGAESYIHTCHS